jgi:hypothetical protein
MLMSILSHEPVLTIPGPLPTPSRVELTLDQLPDRVRDVAALRGLGFTYREIGDHFGLTAQAAAIMLVRHRGQMKRIRSSSDLTGLSPRAANALARLGIRSREHARQFLNLPDHLGTLRNCGTKTVRELEGWLRVG